MQGPYFYRKPELASSTSQSRSHRCPLRAAAGDHGWMASPPEKSSGIPSAAQGQPTGAQCCPCPSSPTSHLLLLHPCVPLHGQGGGAGHDLLLALQDSAPVPLQDPSLGPTRGTDHPEGKPAPSVARARCTVALMGAAPTLAPPAQGWQAGSLPSLHTSLQGTVTLACSGWSPNCTASLSGLCLGHGTRAGAPNELFHSFALILRCLGGQEGEIFTVTNPSLCIRR